MKHRLIILAIIAFFFLMFNQTTLSASVTLGSGVNITNGTTIKLSGSGCNLTVIDDHIVTKLEVHSTFILINASTTAPTYILNLPYNYSSATTTLNITGRANTTINLTINASTFGSGIKIYNVSGSNYLTSVIWTAATGNLSVTVNGTTDTNSTIHVYWPYTTGPNIFCSGCQSNSSSFSSTTNITVLIGNHSSPIIWSILTPNNTAPSVTTPSIIPNAVLANNSMNCSTNATDSQNLTLWVNFTWFKNDSLVSDYNSSVVCANASTCYTNTTVPDSVLNEGDQWICAAIAYDKEYWSDWSNSSTKTIEPISTNLSISDWQDPTNVSLQVNFSGNYTDGNGTVLDNSSAALCTIDFNIGGWVGATNMTYNVTTGNWTYNRTFSVNGTYNWTISCDKNNYAPQQVYDTITVGAADSAPPVITWESPTIPDKNATTNNSIYLNTTITDGLDTAAFFDWNFTLVGYWSFDYYNSSYILGNSSYNINGTFNGTAFGTDNITTGKFGEGLKFNASDDYIEFNSAAASGNTSVTVLFWLKAPLQGSAIPIGSGTYENDGWYIWVRASHAMALTLNNDSLSVLAQSNNNMFDNNTWTHIAIVFNQTDIVWYKNGNEFGSSDSVTVSWVAPTTNLRFGEYITGVSNFNGTLDEIQIHSRALSAQEINASYSSNLSRLYRNFSNLSDATYNYSVYAIDNSGNLNITNSRSVIVNIGGINTAPSVSTPAITPGTVYTNSNMNCSTNATDSENTTLYVNFTWYLNGTMNNSYNRSMTCTNATTCYTGTLVPAASLNLGDTWICSVRAYDGSLWSSWTNSSPETVQAVSNGGSNGGGGGGATGGGGGGASGTLNITEIDDSITTDANSTFTTTFTILNNESVDIHEIYITIEGIPSIWEYTLNATYIDKINRSGGKAVVELTIEIPQQTEASYDITIEARGKTSGGVVKTTEKLVSLALTPINGGNGGNGDNGDNGDITPAEIDYTILIVILIIIIISIFFILFFLKRRKKDKKTKKKKAEKIVEIKIDGKKPEKKVINKKIENKKEQSLDFKV